MEGLLGEGCRVISEGFNGRTIDKDDPNMKCRKGIDYLPPCIASHSPLDALLIMLGTNDLKSCYNASVEQIAQSAGNLLRLAQITSAGCEPSGTPAKILFISPVLIHPLIEKSPAGKVFGRKEGYEKSKRLASAFEVKAREFGVDFLDASRFAYPSPIDCIHLDADGHKALAEALCEKLVECSRSESD